MNLQDLSAGQLRRAAAVKERIDRLNKELGDILGAPAKARATGSVKRGAQVKKKMSPATRRKLSAKLKAHWAAKKAGKK